MGQLDNGDDKVGRLIGPAVNVADLARSNDEVVGPGVAWQYGRWWWFDQEYRPNNGTIGRQGHASTNFPILSHTGVSRSFLVRLSVEIADARSYWVEERPLLRQERVEKRKRPTRWTYPMVTNVWRHLIFTLQVQYVSCSLKITFFLSI